MKRISRSFAVLALCLFLLALPLGSLAESMNLLAVNFTDPVLLQNGTPILDLAGLELDLTAGGTAAMDKGTLQAQLLGGGESAFAALAEISDGQLVLTADGLSNKYSVSLESLASTTGMDTSSLAIAQELGAALVELASGSLPEELMGPISEYMTAFQATIQDQGTTTYTMLSGEMEMQHLTASLTPEMADNLFGGICEVLDNNAEFQAFLAKVIELTGASELDGISFAETYAQLGMSQKIDADVYTTEDGSYMALEMVQTASQATSDDKEEMHYRILVEAPEDGTMNVYADVDIYDDGQPEDGLYFAFSQTPNAELDGSDYLFEFGAGDYEGDEYESDVEILCSASPVLIDGVQGGQFSLQATAEGQKFTVQGKGCVDGSDIYGDFTAEADGAELFASFDGQANDDGSLTGKLELGATANGESYSLQTDVKMYSIEADSATVIVGADGAVDILSLDAEGQQTLLAELGGLAMNGVSVLDRNVSGLSGVMGQLIGGMSY